MCCPSVFGAGVLPRLGVRSEQGGLGHDDVPANDVIRKNDTVVGHRNATGVFEGGFEVTLVDDGGARC